jgi:hypothetical protein
MTATVTCAEHGLQQATYVCQHIVETLRDSQPRGFYWAASESEQERPDAWCAACEQRAKVPGWSDWTEEDYDFLQIKLLCGACHDRAKALNGL